MQFQLWWDEKEIFNVNGFFIQPYLLLYKPISASWAYKWVTTQY